MDISRGESAYYRAGKIGRSSLKERAGFVEDEAVFVGMSIAKNNIWEDTDGVLSCRVHEIERSYVVWLDEAIVI